MMALTRSPSSKRIDQSDVGGGVVHRVPVAVWQRGTCLRARSGTADANCSGLRFRAAFDPLLSASAIDTCRRPYDCSATGLS